jgi:uncharacterized membrane protein
MGFITSALGLILLYMGTKIIKSEVSQTYDPSYGLAFILVFAIFSVLVIETATQDQNPYT